VHPANVNHPPLAAVQLAVAVRKRSSMIAILILGPNFFCLMPDAPVAWSSE
jgi:hypothetical protein